MKEEHLQVKRRHGPTVAEQLKWHLGTLAAVVCLVLLALQIFGVAFGPSQAASDAAGALESTVDRVRASVAARSFPADERMKSLDDQIGALRTTLKHQAAPVEAGEGITYPAAYLKTLQPGESNEIKFEAPVS